MALKIYYYNLFFILNLILWNFSPVSTSVFFLRVWERLREGNAFIEWLINNFIYACYVSKDFPEFLCNAKERLKTKNMLQRIQPNQVNFNWSDMPSWLWSSFSRLFACSSLLAPPKSCYFPYSFISCKCQWSNFQQLPRYIVIHLMLKIYIIYILISHLNNTLEILMTYCSSSLRNNSKRYYNIFCFADSLEEKKSDHIL